MAEGQLDLDWGERRQVATFEQANETSELIAGFRAQLETPETVFPSVDEAARLVEKWRGTPGEQPTVGIVTGCFDLTHPNHQYYLTIVRASIARHHAESTGVAWDSLEVAQQQAIMAGDGVKLVVSVDANDLVQGRKGQGSDFPRPINSWEQRAADVSRFTYPVNLQGERYLFPVADAVTIHTIRADFDGEGKPPSGDLDVIRAIGPDVWAVYEESWATNLAAASDYGVEIPMIQVATNNSLINPHTGEEYGTTDTAKWITQGVEHGDA